MSEAFNGEWWSVSLPNGWKAQREAHGASFSTSSKTGTLQISAARKESGDATEADLLEFAGARGASLDNLLPIRSTAFSGFVRNKCEQGLRWKEWWLRYGPFIIYATYVTPAGQASREELSDAEEIVSSIAIR